MRLIIKEKNYSFPNRHLFDMLDLLVKKYDWIYVSSEDLINGVVKNKYPKIDHLLLITGSSMIKHYQVYPETKISYIIDDLHTGGKIKLSRMKTMNKIYRIFATYAYCFNQFYPVKLKENQLVFFPHSARYITPFNNNPEYTILLTGRIRDKYYPARNKLKSFQKIYSQIKYFKPNYKGYRLERNEYNQKNLETLVYGEKYSKLLNQYLICFTCDSTPERPYLVAKHFEIMGSGSLLFTCNPNTKKIFKELGFIDMEDYVSCNLDNMEDKIKWLLNPDNLDKINLMRKKAYDKVCLHHTWLNRTHQLNQILK